MQQYQEETNLQELLQVVWKYKTLVIAITGLAIALGLALVLILPKYYISSFVVRNGFIYENNTNSADLHNFYPMQFSDLENYIKSSDILKPVLKNAGLSLGPDAFVAFKKNRIRISPAKNSTYFCIEVESSSPDTSLRIAAELAERYIAYGNELCTKQLNIIHTRAAELARQRSAMEKDMSQARAVESSRNGVSPEGGQRIISLQNPLPQLQNNFQALLGEQTNLQIILARSKYFYIVDRPVKAQSPAKPRKKFILGLFMICGAALGLAAAFVAEALSLKPDTAQ